MKQGRVLVLRSTSRYIRYELLGDFSVRLLDKLQPLSLLTLRAILGVIFLYHGYRKLTHTHGNLQAVFVEHGLPPHFVYLSGTLETFGGGLLLLGLFTRPAALLLAIEMCVAI
jgi:putative oxidoreductase